MSHAAAFDTLSFVKKLEASGIVPEQSEAIASAVTEIFEENLTLVPTKTDIDKLDTKIDKLALEMDAKIDKLTLEMDTRFEKMDTKIDNLSLKVNTKFENLSLEMETKLSKQKSEIIMWMVTLMFAQSAMFAMFKLIH